MLRFPMAFFTFFFVLLLIGIAVIAWRNPENKWLFGGYPYQAYVVLGFVVVMLLSLLILIIGESL